VDAVSAADVDARVWAHSWLTVKLWSGTAALDTYDPTVIVVEVTERQKAYRLHDIGEVTSYVRWKDGWRVSCRLDKATLRRLGLDGPDAPTWPDVPLASRGLRVVR
jgi:hypothetical protein